MLKHDVQSVREDEHTFTLDEAELAGMVRGVAMRALKVKDEDPNVIVGTPNIQVISGSVAAVLKVVIKQADPALAPAPEIADPKDKTEARPAETPAPAPEAPAEQPASAPVAADPEPAPAPEPAAPAAPAPAAPAPAPATPPAAVPGFVPGFSKAA